MTPALIAGVSGAATLLKFKFSIVSMHSGNCVCAPPCLSEDFPVLRLKQFQCWSI